MFRLSAFLEDYEKVVQESGYWDAQTNSIGEDKKGAVIERAYGAYKKLDSQEDMSDLDEALLLFTMPIIADQLGLSFSEVYESKKKLGFTSEMTTDLMTKISPEIKVEAPREKFNDDKITGYQLFDIGGVEVYEYPQAKTLWVSYNFDTLEDAKDEGNIGALKIWLSKKFEPDVGFPIEWFDVDVTDSQVTIYGEVEKEEAEKAPESDEGGRGEPPEGMFQENE